MKPFLLIVLIALQDVSYALDTLILQPNEVQTVYSFAGTTSLRLLYRASRDGFAASAFHEKCDNITGGTITIMKSNHNSIFGGYTSVTWDSVSWYKYDSKAYIFSLRRNGVSNDEKFGLVSNTVPAIACLGYYGPTFGGGHDIYTCDLPNVRAESYTRYCWHYNCPEKLKFTNESEAYLAGSYNYILDEIEVYQILRMDSVILRQKEVDVLYEMTQASSFNILYRGSRDGLSSTNFHSKCDNITNTTVIIKTDKNYVFGGYVSVEWDSYSWYKYDSSAYLFSLRRNGLFNYGKFNLLKNGPAIACLERYGPTFGGGHDIYIQGNPYAPTSYTRFCWQYECPEYLTFGNDSMSYFAGSYDNFSVIDIEVYQTIFKNPNPMPTTTANPLYPPEPSVKNQIVFTWIIITMFVLLFFLLGLTCHVTLRFFLSLRNRERKRLISKTASNLPYKAYIDEESIKKQSQPNIKY